MARKRKSKRTDPTLSLRDNTPDVGLHRRKKPTYFEEMPFNEDGIILGSEEVLKWSEIRDIRLTAARDYLDTLYYILNIHTRNEIISKSWYDSDKACAVTEKLEFYRKIYNESLSDSRDG